MNNSKSGKNENCESDEFYTNDSCLDGINEGGLCVICECHGIMRTTDGLHYKCCMCGQKWIDVIGNSLIVD